MLCYVTLLPKLLCVSAIQWKIRDVSAGRVVVEVFEDQAPLATRHLINRCREGTTDSLQDTYVHRMLPDLAIFFGTSRGWAAWSA
jgi:cyclophilin family peptidyl-prolyl cis-trans isomerase